MPTTKKATWLKDNWANLLFICAMIFTSCLFFDQKFTIYYWIFAVYRPQKLVLSFILPLLTGIICYIKSKNLIVLADCTALVMVISAFLYGLDVFFLHWSLAETDALSTFSIIYKLETFFSVLLLMLIITLIENKREIRKSNFSEAYHCFMCGFTPLFVVMFVVIYFFARDYNVISEINLLPFHGELNYLINSEADITLLRDVGNIAFFALMSLILLELNKKHHLLFGIFVPIIISVIMEMLQYALGNGKTDIDDVIANTLGAIIGFIVYQFIIKKIKEKELC